MIILPMWTRAMVMAVIVMRWRRYVTVVLTRLTTYRSSIATQNDVHRVGDAGTATSPMQLMMDDESSVLTRPADVIAIDGFDVTLLSWQESGGGDGDGNESDASEANGARHGGASDAKCSDHRDLVRNVGH
jgi:hypothetical protein